MHPKLDPQVVPNAFTSDECDNIISSVESELELFTSITSQYTTEKRKSSQVWIPNNKLFEWIYSKLGTIGYTINQNFWNLDVRGFEDLQYTVYNNGDYFDWHIDSDVVDGGMPTRKLGMTLQLTDPSEYEGGNLIINHTEYFDDFAANKGDLIIFPSWCLHKVTPLTQGVRKAVVAWAVGPDFK